MEANLPINNWRDFGSIIRPKGCNLLQRLDDFPDSILVTGCQRSGTTMLSRIITESDEMFNYRFGDDDELDAALILCGEVKHAPQGRYCFQTTYLNECYHEYFHHQSSHKIVWVLRNPYSVVYSMLNNWDDHALNKLTLSCGSSFFTTTENFLLKFIGISAISRLRRACYAYAGKSNQLFELRDNLGKDRFLLVEYDNLVSDKIKVLPLIYDFLSLSYKDEYAEKIHKQSIQKADKLSAKQKATIDNICSPIYSRAINLCVNK